MKILFILLGLSLLTFRCAGPGNGTPFMNSSIIVGKERYDIFIFNGMVMVSTRDSLCKYKTSSGRFFIDYNDAFDVGDSTNKYYRFYQEHKDNE